MLEISCSLCHDKLRFLWIRSFYPFYELLTVAAFQNHNLLPIPEYKHLVVLVDFIGKNLFTSRTCNSLHQLQVAPGSRQSGLLHKVLIPVFNFFKLLSIFLYFFHGSSYISRSQGNPPSMVTSAAYKWYWGKNPASYKNQWWPHSPVTQSHR